MKKVSICLTHLQEKLGDKYAIKAAKESGADAMDFTLFLHDISLDGDVYSRGQASVIAYFTELKEYADSLGIEIHQTHGRCAGFGITPQQDEIFIKNSAFDALATKVLGARYCIVHTPAYNQVGGDRTDDKMRNIFKGLFTGILPYAKKHGIKFAAETHGDSSKYKKMEFFGYIDNLIEGCEWLKQKTDLGEHICVCVDTGHTNLAVKHEGTPSVGDAIRQLGELIEVLHLHDNNGMRDQHKIPGTGDLDWKDIISALDEIGYKGYYNLENDVTHFGEGFEAEEACFSVKVMRQFLKLYGND